MKWAPHGWKLMQSFGSAQIRPFHLLTILSAVLLMGPAGRLAAQQHGDAQEGRNDAMFGTPDRYGVIPQDNIFATTPGLESKRGDRHSPSIFSRRSPTTPTPCCRRAVSRPA